MNNTVIKLRDISKKRGQKNIKSFKYDSLSKGYIWFYWTKWGR